MDLDKILRAHSKKLVDDLRVGKLRRAFGQHCNDGTELHFIVNSAIPLGPAAAAAKRIKEAIEAKYRDTIPIDVAIGLVLDLLEREEIM